MNRKIALVTGASSGIGRITTEKLIANGYMVYAAASKGLDLYEMEEENVRIIGFDVTSDQEVEASIKRVYDECGRIDLLVNGASYGHPGAIECVPVEDIKKQFDVNVIGYARTIQAVLPIMRKQRSGTIINISSSAGRIATPAFGWYCATKYAIEGFTDALRLEVKQFGINVVLIEPGVIKTPFLEKQADKLSKTPHPPEYQSVVDSVSRVVTLANDGEDPVVVANDILKAAIASNPPSRFVMPTSVKFALLCKTVLSTKLWDWAIRKTFSIG